MYDYQTRYKTIAKEYNKTQDELNKEKQIGIIKEVGYGNRDIGYPVLFFTVMINENVGALQIVDGEEAYHLIHDYGVYDVKNMIGKPIWVYESGNIIVWLEPCLMK